MADAFSEAITFGNADFFILVMPGACVGLPCNPFASNMFGGFHLLGCTSVWFQCCTFVVSGCHFYVGLWFQGKVVFWDCVYCGCGFRSFCGFRHFCGLSAVACSPTRADTHECL